MGLRFAILGLGAIPLAAQYAGSAVCTGCHSEIAARYAKTGMARSSGPADADSVSAGGARHAAIGAAFTISLNPPRVAFHRPATSVRGQIPLDWFIGSGNVGRSYVYSRDGVLLQAPVSFYSAAGAWGVSPGYQDRTFIDLARPIEAPCLGCHSSGAQLGREPFAEGGVGCERCHGPGARHAAEQREGRSGPIVNPTKLPPRERDSICEQCHLTGAARVEKAGRRMADFRPGEDWSEYVATFVRTGGSAGAAAATDHAEQLAASRCKQKSGEKLWCGACHDPHDQPSVASESCLGCHKPQPCKPAATGGTCVGCHMPKAVSREGEHVAYTDHSIPRLRGSAAADRRPRFAVYPGTNATARDAALAFGLRDGLEQAARANPRDIPVLAQLAQQLDADQPDRAIKLYEQILALNPDHVAAANLAVHRMRQGRTSEAIALWQRVFDRHPELASVGVNLATAQQSAGLEADARRTRARILHFYPDLQTSGPQIR